MRDGRAPAGSGELWGFHRLSSHGVLDHDEVSVAAGGPGEDDTSVGNGDDLCAGRRCQVDSCVELAFTGDRMDTHPEAARGVPQGEHFHPTATENRVPATQERRPSRPLHGIGTLERLSRSCCMQACR